MTPGKVRLIDLSGKKPSVEDRDAARRAHERLREYFPGQTTMVDDLIEERRREAAGE